MGEAAVIRNIGGRVTSAVIGELALLRKLTQAAGADFNEEWNFVVLQHNDCGILRMQNEQKRLAAFFGIDEAALDAKKISDPHSAVQVDVAALRGAADLPSEMRCSGYVYDVNTGLIETVVSPE